MRSIVELEERLRALLTRLDQLAEALNDEDFEDLNAELEDMLFMLSQIDPRDADADEELADTLDALEALGADYARWDAARDIAGELDVLIQTAQSQAGARVHA